ncbi:MAG TPA: cytochrome c peroxidase [Rubrivivax sp.]
MHATLKYTLGSLVAALVATGCANRGAEVTTALPPMPYPADNPTSPAKVALGAQLFVDKRLSGSGQMACQGCHYRELGWTDALPLSKRDDGQTNTRHTPSLYNVGHQSTWYWDGRAATLEGQTLAAWRNQMGADPAKVAAALNAVPGYASQFQVVYGAPASADNIVKSLTTYLRTKNSDNAPWDRYERGDNRAVSADAVAGQKLFMGKGGCVTCHAPPLYGNSTFFNIGLEAGKAKPDIGRLNVSKNEADTSAFKTPSLRSVALGAPYFHDGSRATLAEAVRYMAGGGGDDPKKSPLLQPTGLSEPEIAQVVEFLKTLTSTEPWQAPKLP